MPLIIPSTASSIAASSNTMLAALPPSSNVAVFLVADIDLAIALPTSVEPVNAILLISGWLTKAAPVIPSPGQAGHIRQRRQRTTKMRFV